MVEHFQPTAQCPLAALPELVRNLRYRDGVGRSNGSFAVTDDHAVRNEHGDVDADSW